MEITGNLMAWSDCEVLVEDALASCVGCTVASTNLQPKPAAEPKSAVSVKNYRR